MSKLQKGSTSKKEGNLKSDISLSFCTTGAPLARVWRSTGEGNARCVFVPQKPLVSPCGALFILQMNLDIKTLLLNQK